MDPDRFRRYRRVAGLLALEWAATCGLASAQDAPVSAMGATTAVSSLQDGELTEEQLAELPLEELLNVVVVTPAKEEQTVREAPAIISVITRDDIELWGYTSVAEALENVPGFYPIDDHVSPSFGVRGIHAGQRAYNRIIKVMINGQPTVFRPDGSNFLGPEFLPMSAVERIEVVRGPASALYGANAYLGVVNVITSRPDRSNGRIVGRVGAGPSIRRYGGETMAAYGASGRHALGAVGLGYADRSGLRLPRSSPQLDTFDDTLNSNDTAQPRAAFVSLGYQTFDALHLSAQAGFSRLDTFAEFLDFGTLTHQNRVVQENVYGRVQLDLQTTQNAQTMASFAYASGGPASSERLNSGSSTSFPRRNFGYRSLSYSIEEQVSLGERASVLAGADYLRDAEQPLSVDTVRIGKATPRSREKDIVFEDLGAYAQGTFYPFAAAKGLGLTVNGRYDSHSVYGGSLNYRFGLVNQFGPSVTAKLLVGSSYQAPNAFQLYAVPLYAGEVVGNPELEPERANTVEGQFTVLPTRRWLISVNGFATRAENKIELIPVGSVNLRPKNSGRQDALGFESETRWTPGRHSLALAVAGQTTTDRDKDPFLGTLTEPSPSYPRWIVTASWLLKSGPAGTWGIREKYVSARRASKSNIAQTNEPYLLKPYFLTSATWTYTFPLVRLQLQVDNLWNAAYADPGFRGIDFPGHPREVAALIEWRL